MSNLRVSGTPGGIALRDPRSAEPWRNPDWQQLWLASVAQRRPWRSMALLPAASGASPEIMLEIATTLAHTGMLHLGMPIHVADATRISLPQLVQFSEEVERYTQGNGMIILALSALNDNVTSLTLAQQADCALLCVLMGRMGASEAKKTVDRIGAKRFIGSAVFREPGM